MQITKLHIITIVLALIAVIVIFTKKTWDSESKDYNIWYADGSYKIILNTGSSRITNEKASKLFSQAMSAIRDKKINEAKDFLEHADYLYPASPDILTALGGVTEQLSGTRSALVYYQRSLEIDSNFAPAYLDYGNALNKLKLYAQAIDILDRGLKRPGEHWIYRSGGYMGLSIAYSNLNDKRNAGIYLDSCIYVTEDESMKRDLRQKKWKYEAFD
jgi:tetratricopeptide (TPR) repeat protein